MGQLITLPGGDAPVNEGERRAVAKLVERLPNSYLIIPNAELADQGGQRFEYDIIVIAPHAVYVVEVKDWNGQILGDEREWLVNGNTRKAPLALANRKARILKSKLVSAVPAFARVWVEAAVCLASTPSLLDLSEGVARRTFLLDDLAAFLMNSGEVRKHPQDIADLTGAIARTLGERLRKGSGPTRFGQYEVLDLLEQNGDEALYRAQRHDMPGAPHVRLRIVSLSPYLLTEQQQRERREALKRGTEALLRMGVHPNVIAARDVFEDDAGHIILVLDGTEGRSLRQRLHDGTPMTVEERLDVLVGVCRALVHAHGHDVIHRHVEPETILLGDDGIPRLADFSLAKLLVPGTATVWHDDTTGDIDRRYMAPELDQPTYGPPSPATDLYSLGCVLFELFVGTPPFETPSKAFARTPELPEDTPVRLRELCVNLLRGDPRLRLADTKGALAALEDVRGRDGAVQVSGPKDEYVPGDVIDGKFEVRARLGGGGFSKVYRVYWAMDDREYAVKVFNASVEYDKVQREIGILRQIKHPHIVEAVWADQTRAGQWYLVTQLIQGDTLEDYAKGKKRLSPTEAVELTCQLLEALEAIHPDHRRIAELRRLKDEGEITMEQYTELQELESQGIVHRDIKPQNLILTEQGIVLIDFNIASRVGQPVLTQSGTPPYQCPDVTAGVDRWDPTSDLFAVGVVLYELLCFAHPYESAQPRADREPKDPRDYRAELSPELAGFLKKACAPWRDQRFATAIEMRDALQAIHELTISRAVARVGKLTPRLQQLIATAPPNVNPMVREFLSLSSQARRTNRGTRGMDELATATYVNTQLDAQLTASVLEGRHRLVLVTGNAGDGKTAFIQQVEEAAQRDGATVERRTPNGLTLRHRGREIITLYDGSQDEEGRSSDDVLRSFFLPFSIGEQQDGAIRLAAINEGRLRDFLLAHRSDYGDFATEVIATLDAPSETHVAHDTVVVNLNARSVTVGGATSIFSRQLQFIVGGPFWGPCENCDYRTRCPLKHNVDTFRDSTSGAAVTERLRVLVDVVRLRRRRHLTMRDIRSLISHILFRDRTCEEIAEALRQDDSYAVLDLSYFQGPGGAGVDSQTLLERGAELLSEIDVGLVANPEEDRRLARGHGPRRMGFPDRASDYPHELLELARTQAGTGYESDVHAVQRVHKAARRETFFERSDDGWWAMLPYQRLREFAEALNREGATAREKLLLEVVTAISMYEGINDVERARQSLWLATQDEGSEEFRCFRRFPLQEFALNVASVVAPYVETEPDRLQLIHLPSDVKLDLDVDLLEVLDRLREGYVPAMDGGRGFLINLVLFKHQLLAQPTTELLLTTSDERLMRIAIGETPGSVVLTEERA